MTAPVVDTQRTDLTPCLLVAPTGFGWPAETCPDCEGRLPNDCTCGK